MSEINRNQFRGSSLNSIKGEQERAEAALPTKSDSPNRPGFHKIVDGKNWRRIAPAHKAGEPAYRAKSTVSLECEVPEIDDDGKETGKKEVKRKQIFIATQHSSILKEDPIVLYIQFVQKRATDEIQDKDARSKFLAPITGWRGKDGKWNWGIKPSLDYICYCWNEKGELGREQLYPGMLEDMKKLSIERADDTMEIIPDVFTDIDEGYPLIITKFKNDKGKQEMSVSLEMPQKNENWVDFFNRTKITDEQLAELLSKESLTDLYKDVYTTRDFNMAIDGLRRFDRQYNYGIFENEEFIEKISKLKAQVPEYKSKDEQDIDKMMPGTSDAHRAMRAPAPEPKPEPKPQASAPITNAGTPVPTMKKFIDQYITENYGSDYSRPDDLKRDELEKWYMLAKAGDELPFDEYNSIQEKAEDTSGLLSASGIEDVKEQPRPEPKKPIEHPAVEEPASIDPELQEKIAALRRRRNESAGQ